MECRDVWLEWNKQIQETPAEKLPIPLTPEDKLFDACGLFHLGDGEQLLPRYQEYLDVMQEIRPSIRERQFIKGEAADRDRLDRLCPSLAEKYHMFDQDLGGNLNGYLSTTDGVLWADKVSATCRIGKTQWWCITDTEVRLVYTPTISASKQE